MYSSPTLEMEGEGAVVVAREEAHAGGFDGRDDEAGAVPVAIFQRVAARVSWISGWGERFSKGRTSWAGRRRTDSAVRAPVSSQAAEDGGVEGLGGLVVGDDDDAGGVGGADEEGKVERAGGEGEAGDTSAPRASA